MNMITKEQIRAIEDYIEKNFDGIFEMLEQYEIEPDRLAEKWDKADEKVRRSVNATKDELDTLKLECKRADAMHSMANGFLLALLLQKINSKIFVD